jgi:hypothetical protein
MNVQQKQHKSPEHDMHVTWLNESRHVGEGSSGEW